MGETTQFYAHTPGETGVWHDLISHLKRTSDAAGNNGAKFGAGNVARLAGLWHDLGKFNPEFQKYLKRCEQAASAGEPSPPKGVPHAAFGAKLARGAYPPLMQIIYGHHAGLQETEHVKQRLGDLAPDTIYEEVLRLARENLSDFGPPEDLNSLLDDPPRNALQYEFLLRMIFSALVDADFIDTESHFDPGSVGLRGSGNIAPVEMLELLERDQKYRFAQNEDTTRVNRVRDEVYEACVSVARMPRGVFRLSVPTGGGKTRSGMAFALRHAVEHGMDRVIVAAPYTSIIDQTARVYRDIFGSEAVLEHHSAVQRDRDLGDPSEAERLHERQVKARLATQNWDAPLVVTTTVQLFQSLFADRTSRCRKLHNISRSVILLDEVQTLPAGLLAPIVNVLGELVRRYGASVVLCTATQPALDGSTPYLEGFESVEDIVPRGRAASHFRALRRVRYEIPEEEWSWGELAGRVEEEAEGGSALVVLNARKDALAVLDALGDDRPILFHLSTLLCGAHRRDVLEEVRRRLKAGEPCLLVSTQVVEAGVDLDFPIVFRALGPLDRIVQAAGRCNREGKMPAGGRVFIFRPQEGRMPRGEYASAFDQTEVLLKRQPDLHDPEVFREYFSQLYQVVSTDREGIQELRERCDYPEVARKFRMIEDDTTPVIVQYTEKDPARERDRVRMLDRIRSMGTLLPGDHRRLQPYVVGLRRSRELSQFESSTEDLVEDVKLWIGSYDKLRGISAARYDPADLVY